MSRLRAGTGRSFNCSLCTTLVQYRLAGCRLIPAIYLDSCGAHNNSQFNPVANKVGLTNCLELTGQRAHCHGQSLSLQERNDCSWVERWWLHFTQLNQLFHTVPWTESRNFNICLCSSLSSFPSHWDWQLSELYLHVWCAAQLCYPYYKLAMPTIFTDRQKNKRDI